MIIDLVTDTAVFLIETSGDLARQFEMRDLILTDGNADRSKREDVRGLAHRVEREAERIVLAEALDLDLVLERGVAHHAIEGEKHREQKGQFGDRGHFTLKEDGGAFRIDAHAEQITDDSQRVFTNRLGLVGPGREGVHVGQDEEAVVGTLKFDTTLDGSHPVTEMKFSGRGVAGENSLRLIGCARHVSNVTRERFSRRNGRAAGWIH